jgi:hypothetical protein
MTGPNDLALPTPPEPPKTIASDTIEDQPGVGIDRDIAVDRAGPASPPITKRAGVDEDLTGLVVGIGEGQRTTPSLTNERCRNDAGRGDNEALCVDGDGAGAVETNRAGDLEGIGQHQRAATAEHDRSDLRCPDCCWR